jgi:Flp pilus assembly protein TadB
MDRIVEDAEDRRSERPLKELLGELIRDFVLLLRQEAELAGSEIAQGFGRLGNGAVTLGLGGLIAFAGFLCLLAAAIMALALVLPLWAAALVVGGVALVVGVLLAFIGRSRMRAEKLVPRRTLKSLEDNIRWAKERWP